MPVPDSPDESNAFERARWNDEHWTTMWPKRERLTDAATPFLLAALELRHGEAVLDIGCGGGKTSIAAAELVGAGGMVVGADISEPLLALARHRAAEAGAAGNLSFVHCDLQRERAADVEFDVAMSQFGVMFFDEPVRAFTAIASQLRPGGRLGFVCWQPVELNPWFIGPVVAPFVAPPPAPAAGKSATGPFAFADRDRVAGILGDAGFTAIAVTGHELEVEAPAVAIVDDEQLVFLGVAEEEMPAARVAVRDHLARFGDPAGTLRFPAAIQVFTARRPPG
jgi:SAM-dependent methyltransferase